MILRHLEILNFRQLHGQARVQFAQGEKNVTVFLGENAGGKTTLLLAMAWCMHGDDALESADLRNPSDLLSHRALQEAGKGEELEVRVQLEFEHDNRRFSVERIARYQKIESGSESRFLGSEFSVRATSPGNIDDFERVDAPSDEMDRVLPQALLPYFFFQGEAAGRMVDPRLADGLRAAVEEVLDLTVLSNARTHLNTVHKDLSSSLRKIARDDGGELEQRIEEHERKRDELQELLETAKAELQASAKRLHTVDDALLNYEKTRPLIEEKARLVATAEQLREQRAMLEADIAQLIRSKAYEAVLVPAIDSLKGRLEAAYRRDDLPARIKPGFVDELIKRQRCICGTQLAPGSDAMSGIEEFRQGSGLDLYADALQHLDGRLSESAATVTDFRERFRSKKADLDERVVALRKAQGRLMDIERVLENQDSDEDRLSGLLATRRKLLDDRARLKADVDRQSERFSSIVDALAELEKQRESRHRNDTEARRYSRQLSVLSNVSGAVAKLHDGWLRIVQEYLDDRIQVVYDNVAKVERRVSFDRRFMLSMEEHVDGRWVPSDASGANQAVLALCFVASFIELADHISSDEGGGGVGAVASGARYPMVMDAPFAKMGEDFSSKVPTYLAQSVPQLVIMTSERQWSGAVEDALSRHVGRAYALQLHSNRAEDTTVAFMGRKVDYVAADAEEGRPDFTLLREIEL